MPEEVSGRPPGQAIDASATGRRPALLSVVAPVCDEEDTIGAFHARVSSALEGIPFELVLVDDGSTDSTPELLDRLADTDPRVKVVTLSRNFGHQTAVTAGLEHARGDVVVTIDSDLQDPPEVIHAMLERWGEGADVVSGVRSERLGETRFKLATASWFYRLFAKLSPVRLERDAGDFRLVDRRVLEAILAMPERNRFLRGMTGWVGFEQTAVGYERDARQAGRTKYTVRKMLRFSFDGISSFSYVPLQLSTLLGILILVLALIGLPVGVIARLAGVEVPGAGAVILVVLLLGGIQLITVGLIGEYVGRIYEEVKRRPLYVVARRRNVAEPEAQEAPERERVAAR